MGSGGMVGGMLYKRSFSCQVLVLEEGKDIHLVISSLIYTFLDER